MCKIILVYSEEIKTTWELIRIEIQGKLLQHKFYPLIPLRLSLDLDAFRARVCVCVCVK